MATDDGKCLLNPIRTLLTHAWNDNYVFKEVELKKIDEAIYLISEVIGDYDKEKGCFIHRENSEPKSE